MESLTTVSEVLETTLESLENRTKSSYDTPLVDSFDALGSMERGGFPSKFRRFDWLAPEFVAKYAPPDSRDGFRDFRGLFLTGPTGRKKTASLCLMARDWLSRVGRKGSKAWRFVSFPELCVELQQSWNGPDGGPLEIINRLCDVPLLIIDDVGVEKTTEFVLQSAYLLFNKREQAELPTYGTSNLTIDEIGSKLDERIASRIRGMCHVVSVGGVDHRGLVK